MNKIKQSLFIIICLMSQISQAQKVSVMWNNYENEKLALSVRTEMVEIDNKFYSLTYPFSIFFKEFNLTMLDENLNFLKTINIPTKYDGNEITPISMTKAESSIIIIFSYFETTGENRQCLIKTVFNKNLTNPVKFEKIEDIQTKSYFNPKTDWDLYYYNENRDVIIMKVPREALKKSDVYNITAYNNSLSKKEWTATMDLGKLAEDYILTDNLFSSKAEFVFILKIEQKGFKLKTGNMLLCKFSKQNGLTFKEIVFKDGENDYESSLELMLNKAQDKIYIYGHTKRKGTENDYLYLKNFDIETLSEIDNISIDLGNPKENGLNDNTFFGVPYTIDDFVINTLDLNNENGNITIVGEACKFPQQKTQKNPDGTRTSYLDPGMNSTILCLKINKEGKILEKYRIPRKMKLKTYEHPFSSYIFFQDSNGTSFLFYDDPKNENFTSFNKDIKIKQIDHDKDLDLYVVKIDKNNKISKSKVVRDYTGNLSKLTKKQNFETYMAKPFSKNKFLVKAEKNVGILTIE